MSERKVVLGALVALLYSCFPCVAERSENDGTDHRPPNVVFILADDLGWGDLGCYGNPIATPRLDQMAKEGALFTRFYVNGSVCSPSRTAFTTGHFPARHGIHGHLSTHDANQARGMPNWLDPNVPTLADQFHAVGYATAHVGKWHLGHGPGAPSPKDYGFDFVKATTSGDDTWTEANADPFFRAKSTRLFVDESLAFIAANRSRPFYLQLWTLLPHATLNPLPEQLKPFERYGPGKGAGAHKGARSIFYSSVADLDAQIGRLLDGLAELGLDKNTIILFSSDNGPEDIMISNAGHSGVGSTGPFRGRKRSLYEGGIRVPFLVRWPGHVAAGRVDDTSVVSAVDFFPTLSALARADLPANFQADGENVSEILLKGPASRSKPLFWEWRFNIAGHPLHHSPILSIRDGDWKLLFNPDRSRVELYDPTRDPMELTDLTKEHPDVVRRLSETGLAWQKSLPTGPMDPAAGKRNFGWPKSTQGKTR
ncbi:MAG: sulfatase-like hydrolase/transferase [Planctomycetota bacterium]